MNWTRICAPDEMREGRARSMNLHGTGIMVTRFGNRYLAIPPVCIHTANFLCGGDSTECFDGDSPRCNESLPGASAEGEDRGISEAPIFSYAMKVENGDVLVDLDRRQLTEFERITCSPVLSGSEVRALRFTLWSSDGTRREALIHGYPANEPFSTDAEG